MKNRLFCLICLLSGLLPVASVSAATTVLVDHRDGWLYRKGTNAPQGDWKTALEGNLDATWLGPAPGGFGFADGDDATVLDDMASGAYTTVYIRRTFNVTDALDPNLALQLTVDWDDGYVAWLDGVEIARDRAPGAAGVEPAFNATATSTHDAVVDGGAQAILDLGPVADRLAPGLHVLAVMGLNNSSTSSDLSLIVDLAATEPPLPPLVSHQNDWYYCKGTNAPVANWQTLPEASLGAEWLRGPGGFGYGDGDDGTVLSDMLNHYTTIYIRQTFQVDAALATDLNLLLVMDWDDGFVAYLDGVEVARALAPGLAGEEPAHTATATGLHEASSGSGGNPPTTYDLGHAAQLLPPGSHTLALMGLNESADSSDVSLIADLALGEAPPPDPGLIDQDTTWTLENSPYVITQNLTVADGVTLTIEPGVTVAFNQGLSLVVRGRLLAEGTADQRITFTRTPGAASWSQIRFESSPFESRITFADIRFATGSNVEARGMRLYLENVVWSNTTSQLLDASGASIHVVDCVFPSTSGQEPLHFSNMPASGYARIEGCLFNAPSGYNDVIDLTGGNRPGPIAEFLNNVFLAAVDECFDLDGSDAHIEGNIFLDVRQDAARSSSANAVATGGSGGETSELVIVRNYFYNCEHVLLLKERCSAILENNTIVGIYPNPVGAQPPAFINFGEPNRGVVGGAGALLDGNLVWDLQGEAFLNFTNEVMFLTVNRSLIQNTPWPGLGNGTNDPMFVSLEGITAENIRTKLALRPGSPALGTGPNGLDMGADVPGGATISGEPEGTVTNTTATLTVAGPGIYAYRWKLNEGPWSQEVALTNSILIHPGLFANAQPIALTGLTNGTYTVSVVGKNSAGSWQSTDTPTLSKTWTVQTEGLLEISGAERVGDVLRFQFTAQAGQTYTVQYSDSLWPAAWRKLEDVLAQPVTGPYIVSDPLAGEGSRFYRVVTPAQPSVP